MVEVPKFSGELPSPDEESKNIHSKKDLLAFKYMILHLHNL